MNRDRCSAFPDRRRFSPPAAGVKAGRRPPAGLGLDGSEDRAQAGWRGEAHGIWPSCQFCSYSAGGMSPSGPYSRR
jgi:hypothetical protein